MQTEIMIAGFGGQGVLFAGQVMAYAAMDSGMEVTWFPSYGPEMRGGTANCTVIIGDEEIGSPLVLNPRAAIIMNLPSLEKYVETLQPEGVLIINASLINQEVARTDLSIARIPANEIAEEIGNKRLTNMVLLGALLARLPVLKIEAVEKALEEHLPARHQHLLPLNFKALRAGAELAMKEAEPAVNS